MSVVRDDHENPRELGRLLDSGYEIRTFHLRGTPAMSERRLSRMTEPVDPAVPEWLPDVVFIEQAGVDSWELFAVMT